MSGQQTDKRVKMNYLVFDSAGADWRSIPQVFATLQEAQEYCNNQNARYSGQNPFVIRKLVEVGA